MIYKCQLSYYADNKSCPTQIYEGEGPSWGHAYSQASNKVDDALQGPGDAATLDVASSSLEDMLNCSDASSGCVRVGPWQVFLSKREPTRKVVFRSNYGITLYQGEDGMFELKDGNGEGAFCCSDINRTAQMLGQAMFREFQRLNLITKEA